MPDIGDMTPRELEQRVEAARRFNRFYTRRIGVLREGAYKSPFSLTEVRVLYELAHRDQPTATELGRELGLDAGYLSRILRGFERRGLILKTRSADDGRQSHLALTPLGRKVFAPLNARSHGEMAAMLRQLSPAARARLIAAMRTIEQLLGERPEPPAPQLLRPPRAGELGWVVERHGALYAQEYGYDEEFEALVAEIVAHFVQHYDAKRERCWIAERDGEPVGCVFLVKQSPTIAKLRLLLVDPSARGSGLGTRLVSECVGFARRAGYRKLTLWTQSELRAARRLYQAAGFHLVHRKRHTSFGKGLVAETWDLAL
jgi:DNA-binding MarR family transcriptional regulator/N-acetylglutamate synthase-like GNAT family acetyltransferase